MRQKILVFGILSMLLLTSMTTLSAAELKTGVSKASSGYIQSLIDAASPGDRIYIPNGLYYENIVINKTLTLVGEDRYNTIIDGGNKKEVVFIDADRVNISSFTIKNSGWNSENFAGIYVNSNYVTISDNIIIQNWYGILLDYSDNNIISCNIISDNKVDGIYLFYSSNSIISENTLRIHFYDIYLLSSNNNLLYHNNLLNNERQAYDDGINTWDVGYPSGGNYWAFYFGEDENGDGIVDTPYKIEGGNNKDNHPLFYILGKGNRSPNTPRLSGPTTGKRGHEYKYTIYSFDPEADDVYYKIRWGDGTESEWAGPYISGEKQNISHIFQVDGPKQVTAFTKDINGNICPTASSTYIIISKNKQYINRPALKFLQHYNCIFSILKNLQELLKQ